MGPILGSQKTYQCSFKPIDGGAAQHNSATVAKIGVDIGITGNTIIIWSGLAADQQVQQRPLSGDYTGVAADAAIGVGGGAKVLWVEDRAQSSCSVYLFKVKQE